MSETELLSALFAASSGMSAGAANAGGGADLITGQDRGQDREADQAKDPSGDPGWRRFLALLAAQTEADTAALFVDQGSWPNQGWRHGPPLPVQPEPDQMRSSRIYSQADLPGLYRRTLSLRALRTPTGPWGRAVLTLHRDRGDFRAIDGVRLSGLLPFLGPALLTWQRLARERQQAARAQAMLRGQGAGWVQFSPAGAILERSEGASALFEAAGIRLMADGRPGFRDGTTAARLRKALSEASAGASDSEPLLVRLSETPRLEMLICHELTSTERRLTGFLRLEHRARALCPDWLARHLGLSRSEARLAQRLCDGLTLAEAAADLSWTIETARSCSKQVYARMGLRGQGDLLRRMQASALWLAPEAAPGAARAAP